MKGKVFVYRNLHKKCYSIKALDGPSKGLVIGHAFSLVLRDATFQVSIAGQARVRHQKVKSVHAGVVGYTVDCSNFIPENRIVYNPYVNDCFVFEKSGEHCKQAPLVFLGKFGVYTGKIL